jgi:hypothetical protein
MTTEQSYARHAHRPVLTNIAGLFALVALIAIAGAWLFGWGTRDLGTVSLVLSVIVLIAISRIYTVRLQDRIILLEMRVRGAELLTPEQEALLAALHRRQVIALRFASDEELPLLVEQAAREKLTADQIKRAIKRWRADHLRT